MSVITRRILKEITQRGNQVRNYVHRHGGLIGGLGGAAAVVGTAMANNPELMEQAVQIGKQGYSYGRKLFRVNDMLDQANGSVQTR